MSLDKHQRVHFQNDHQMYATEQAHILSKHGSDRQLRVRRALSIFKDVPLKTRRGAFVVQ